MKISEKLKQEILAATPADETWDAEGIIGTFERRGAVYGVETDINEIHEQKTILSREEFQKQAGLSDSELERYEIFGLFGVASDFYGNNGAFSFVKGEKIFTIFYFG